MIPLKPDHKPDSLLDAAAWLVENRPDDTALVLLDGDEERTYTYREFFALAQRSAAAIKAAGVQRGDLVTLVVGHSEFLLTAFWGAMMAGAVPSIFPFLSDRLDPARYYDSVRLMVQHADVRLLLVDDAMEPGLREHLPDADLVNVNALNAKATVSPPQVQPDDVAFLQHSSGSTGLQKGVMLSHRAVLNHLASYGSAINLSRDDVIVSWLPLYHDMGLIASFILPLTQGVPLVLLSPFQWVRTPVVLWEAVTRHKATLCWLPNFAYNFMATRIRDKALNDVDLSSLRAVINCSEPVFHESHRVFLERFTPYGLRESALATCYAMAENVFAVTQAGIDSPPRLHTTSDGVPRVSCGKPIPNCEVIVVDEARQPLPDGEIGEIALKSDSMLTGYYRRPDLTAQAIADGWYYTGDMGYMLDGELFVSGRKKDLIIVGGKNVYPQDIENLLHDVPGVHPGRVVAFGVFNDQLGTEDVGVVAELDDLETKFEVMRNIRARVAQNTDVTAKHVHLVERGWLVKTSSGKVARRANRDKFLNER